jgi:hypothetical protein
MQVLRKNYFTDPSWCEDVMRINVDHYKKVIDKKHELGILNLPNDLHVPYNDKPPMDWESLKYGDCVEYCGYIYFITRCKGELGMYFNGSFRSIKNIIKRIKTEYTDHLSITAHHENFQFYKPFWITPPKKQK